MNQTYPSKDSQFTDLGEKKFFFLLLEEPMHLVKTNLLGNWKENNCVFFFWQRNEGRSVLQSINDSLFPRSAPLEKTSFSEVTLMSLTNRTLEDKFNKQNPGGLTSHWRTAAPG